MSAGCLENMLPDLNRFLGTECLLLGRVQSDPKGSMLLEFLFCAVPLQKLPKRVEVVDTL